MNAVPEARKVAVITGASQGIGAGLADGYRQAGYAVVGVALSMAPSDEPDYLSIQGDITEAETAQRVVDQALDRFGRVDTLVNNAGIYIGKPFTDYTLDDYVAITAVNLAGFFHITQRTIPQMVSRGSGHIVNISTSLVDHADSKRPSALPALTKGGLVAVTRSRQSNTRRADCGSTRYPSASSRLPRTIRCPTQTWAAFTLWVAWARSPTSSREFSISRRRRSSPGRRCTSTAGRQPDTDAAGHAH
jgi:hypothetical protein